MSFRYCSNVAVLQLERCSKGDKISFRGGQTFWDGLLFSEFSVDLQKKKVVAPNWSNFLQDFCSSQKKKSHLTKMFCLFHSLLLLPPQKSHHLKRATRERGLWVGILEFLGGRNFCLGGCRLLLFRGVPRSCGPAI